MVKRGRKDPPPDGFHYMLTAHVDTATIPREPWFLMEMPCCAPRALKECNTVDKASDPVCVNKAFNDSRLANGPKHRPLHGVLSFPFLKRHFQARICCRYALHKCCVQTLQYDSTLINLEKSNL